MSSDRHKQETFSSLATFRDGSFWVAVLETETGEVVYVVEGSGEAIVLGYIAGITCILASYHS